MKSGISSFTAEMSGFFCWKMQRGPLWLLRVRVDFRNIIHFPGINHSLILSQLLRR